MRRAVACEPYRARPRGRRGRCAAGVLLALALLALAGCGEGGEAPAPSGEDAARAPAFDLTGTWRGQLAQRGLDPFRIEATIRSLRSSERGNVVRYSGIDCGGDWNYLGRDGEAFRFREVIDRGRGGECKGVGTVTLEPAGEDRLRYEFRGGGVVSRGVLSRAR